MGDYLKSSPFFLPNGVLVNKLFGSTPLDPGTGFISGGPGSGNLQQQNIGGSGTGGSPVGPWQSVSNPLASSSSSLSGLGGSLGEFAQTPIGTMLLQDALQKEMGAPQGPVGPLLPQPPIIQHTPGGFTPFSAQPPANPNPAGASTSLGSIGPSSPSFADILALISKMRNG